MTYATVFGLLAMAVGVLAVECGGWASVLLAWPALDFGLLAVAYAGGGPGMLGKRTDGTRAGWARALWLPYLLLTGGLWHLQRRISRQACAHEVAPGLWLGRRAFAHELPAGVGTVVDLTAEFVEPRAVRAGRTYHCLPTLDASAPDEAAFGRLIATVATASGPVYVHCAVGHGRSALFVAAVLLAKGVATDATQAIGLVRAARPGARLHRGQHHLLGRLTTERNDPAR